MCVKCPEFYKSVCKDILNFTRVCAKISRVLQECVQRYLYKSVCKDILSCSTEREVMILRMMCFQIDPFPDNRARRPTREIEELSIFQHDLVSVSLL